MTSFVRTPSVVRGIGRSRRFVASAAARVALLAVAPCVLSTVAGSQTPPPLTQPADPGARVIYADMPDATRAELTRLLEQSTREAADANARGAVRERAQNDIAAIRRRLETGDFRAGDRFLLTVKTDSIARLEVLVRDGPDVDFGTLSTLSLAGVLYAEADSVLTHHFRRYYVSPEIEVQLLTRVNVFGAVLRPGPVSLQPDVVVGEIFTVTGLQQSANTQNVTVYRAGRAVINPDRFSQGMRDGLTLDAIGLRSGDEVRVGATRTRNWRRTVWTSMMVFSITTGLLAFIRSAYAD